MSADLFLPAVESQFLGTLAMLRASVQRCPEAHWKQKVGNWPFWLVVYHTLCFADLYAAPGDKQWKPHPEFHPRGRKELLDEFPSREFSRKEMLAYCDYCTDRVRESLKRETDESLAGPTGFRWVPGTRLEHHIYNLRHVAHHTGQLTASLRRAKKKVGWAMGGSKRKKR